MKPLDLEQYRALVEHAPVMVWRAGLDVKRDYFNATWLAFTGRALHQELGDGWAERVHPDDLDSSLALYVDRFERRQAFEMEYRLRRHDDVYRYVFERGVPHTDAGGSFAGFIGSCTDIDERRARDAGSGALEFFEMSLDNLCVTGFDGYFTRLSPSWTKTLGWTAAEMMSTPSVELVHPEDREATLAARARLMAGVPLLGLLNRYRCKDGSYRWFEWRSIAHVERGLVYAAARDVTEQREAQRVLRELTESQELLQRQLLIADRMASVGTLAAGVAHEINNPLTSVMANLQMLGEDIQRVGTASSAAQIADWAEMAVDARQGAERIRKIVRGLNTFARAEAEEQRAVIDVRPVLERSINMAFNEIRHRARLVKEYGEIPLVEADSGRLEQVFINLLVNAAQALPEDSTDTNEIRIVTATDATGCAVIEVRDSGSGIPAGVIGRVFDPFFTTKPVGVGTGLGLSICHNIVSALGGAITASSNVGAGTIFRVVLPAASGRLDEPAPATVAESSGTLARAAILIVDDEWAVGVTLGRVLRDHRVTIVTTAKEALELLISNTPFDVVLSDLMMPEMSGMELYDELVRCRPQAAERMVFITGGAFTAAANAFLDRVPNQRIDKPFDAATVRALVQTFVTPTYEPPARGPT